MKDFLDPNSLVDPNADFNISQPERYLEIANLKGKQNYDNNITEMGIVAAHAFWKEKYDGIDVMGIDRYHHRDFYISFFQCSKELGFLDKIKDIEWWYEALPSEFFTTDEIRKNSRIMPDALNEFMKGQKK